MAKIIETINSLNDENVEEVKKQIASEAEALHNSNQQLYTRAKKAEGFEKKNGEWVKKEVAPKTPEDKPKEPVESNEPDYAKLGFLNSKKIENSDDQKLVLDEAERLKLSLTDVLNMKHIKSQLKDNKDQRAAEEGAPKGKGKSGSPGQNDVDRHLAKGTTPDDLETAEKVIDARMKQETDKGKFSDDLF